MGDAFLRSLMDSDGWVSLEKIMTFPRMKKQKLSLPEAIWRHRDNRPLGAISVSFLLGQPCWASYMGCSINQISLCGGLAELKEWWGCDEEATYLRVGLKLKVKMRCMVVKSTFKYHQILHERPFNIVIC